MKVQQVLKMLWCFLFLPAGARAERRNSRDSFPFVIALPIRVFTSPQQPVIRHHNSRSQHSAFRDSNNGPPQSSSKDNSQDENEYPVQEQRHPRMVKRPRHPFQGTHEDFDENNNFRDSESENQRFRENERFGESEGRNQRPTMFLGWGDTGSKRIMVLNLNDDLRHLDNSPRATPVEYDTSEKTNTPEDHDNSAIERPINHDNSPRVNYDTATIAYDDTQTRTEQNSGENMRINYDVPTEESEPDLSDNERTNEELPDGVQSSFEEDFGMNHDQIPTMEPRPEYQTHYAPGVGNFEETHYRHGVGNFKEMKTISVPLMTTSDLAGGEQAFEGFPDQGVHHFSNEDRFHGVMNDSVKQGYLHSQHFEPEGGIYGTDPVVHYVRRRKKVTHHDPTTMGFEMQHPTQNPAYPGGSWW